MTIGTGLSTGRPHPPAMLPKAVPPAADVVELSRVYPQSLRWLPGVLPGGRMTGASVMLWKAVPPAGEVWS